MINQIVFYNHYHNGDVFISKQYIKYIMSLFPDFEYTYYHANTPKLLKDLGIKTLPISNTNLPQKEQVFVIGKTIYVNTWIGAQETHSKYGCTFVGYNFMWSNIYQEIARIFDTRLPFGNKYYYIPETDYSFYDIPNDLNIDYNNTILFSNGRVDSDQASWQDTDFIVNALLDNFKDKTIILTHKTNIKNNRILYTNDIVKTTDGDLNEISWIAEKCKYLIGRHSGPFIFMHTKNILNDLNKNMIGIGTSETDGLPYAMNINANYLFLNDVDKEQLVKNIIEHIRVDKKVSSVNYKVFGYRHNFGLKVLNKQEGRDTDRIKKSLFRNNDDNDLEQVLLYTDMGMELLSKYKENNFLLLTESRDFVPQIYAYFIKNIDSIARKVNLIFTHDKSLLPLNEKIKWVPANSSWVTQPKIYEKTKGTSMFTSSKRMIPGHRQRFDYGLKLFNKKANVDIYGRGISFGTSTESKEEGLADYMFSITMENASYSGYFTEKILDCFLTGTIPIYYGDPDIGNIFNMDGILVWSEDFDLNALTEELYYSKMDAIKENFEIAKQFYCMEDYIVEHYLKKLEI